MCASLAVHIVIDRPLHHVLWYYRVREDSHSRALSRRDIVRLF